MQCPTTHTDDEEQRGTAPVRRALPRPEAVLFDRDGTLIVDVPYNGDPRRVAPVPGAADVLGALRAEGLRTGIVTNQSGIARGVLRPDDVAAVNERVESLLGPFDAVAVCPHSPDDGCPCRKPKAGLIRAVALALGIDPSACVVVGDIGADVGAAAAAGARAVLVPNEVTRPQEIAAASRGPEDRVAVEPDLRAAHRRIVRWMRG